MLWGPEKEGRGWEGGPLLPGPLLPDPAAQPPATLLEPRAFSCSLPASVSRTKLTSWLFTFRRHKVKKSPPSPHRRATTPGSPISPCLSQTHMQRQRQPRALSQPQSHPHIHIITDPHPTQSTPQPQVPHTHPTRSRQSILLTHTYPILTGMHPSLVTHTRWDRPYSQLRVSALMDT